MTRRQSLAPSPRKISFPHILLVFALVLASPYGRAQQTLGAINGTVTDTSGAVIAGVCNKTRSVTTNLEVGTVGSNRFLQLAMHPSF